MRISFTYRFLFFAVALISFSLSGFAQDKGDFFTFASDFNWSLSEADFKAKYSSRIVPETDSLVVSLGLQKGVYLLNDLKICDHDCLTIIYFSQEEDSPSIMARLTDDELQAIAPMVMAAKLDEIVDQKMREPDVDLDEMPLSTFGIPGLEGINGKMRIWMTETITFATIRSFKDDGLVYLFVARKGEPREPDFRKGIWGDSMATCMSKEGKSNEYGTEDIYAFDTYVANLHALAAYRFTDDRLTSGKYVFVDENPSNCIRDYENLVSLLTKKYGEPTLLNKEYSASDAEKRVLQDGQLLRTGKLVMYAAWTTPFTIVYLSLKGENYNIAMGLEYYSTKLEQVREKGLLDGL